MSQSQSGNAIGKVCSVLKALTSHNGLRLTDVSAATGIHRVTTLRILDELIEQGFVVRLGKPPKYSLGPEALAMAPAPSLAHDVLAAAQMSLVRLADLSEDTVLLSVRSGADAICINRNVGTFPIQANFLQIGARRPLGVGAGSMALLAFLPAAERTTLLNTTAGRVGDYPKINREVLEDHIAAAERAGYVKMLNIVVDRIGGIAMPIRASGGTIVGSVSIAALTERITEREAELARALKIEIEAIGKELSAN